jgi:hypothetical protein
MLWRSVQSIQRLLANLSIEELMAFTQTQLDALDVAIASGTLSVSFSDGKSVTYRSMAELIQARDMMKNSISGTTTRSTLASFSKD